MRLRLTAVVLALALAPSLAAAVEEADFKLLHTEDLLDVCAAGPNSPLHRQAANFCIAYIEGAVDYHDAISAHKQMERLICYPSDVTRTQGVQAFVEWAQANKSDTKLMREATVVGVVRALAAKWPCKKKK
ncbi:MAG: Rap1a/Tai family immunity protein [Alphaproteobacteria bacterium]|nr:Rap1a/Tai family immunity protein [Alphaproteobacteria bacterium]